MLPGNKYNAVASESVLDHVFFILFRVMSVDLNAEFFGQWRNSLLRAQAVAVLADSGGVKKFRDGKAGLLQFSVERSEYVASAPALCQPKGINDSGF